MTPNSVKAYEKKYADGWYPLYPEGDIIRIYQHYFAEKLANIEKPKILDFGCANGTTALFFKSKGFEVFGLDVVSDAINESKRRLPDEKENFKLIEHAQDIENLFSTKFDIILSRQVLYYLSESELKRTLEQFNKMLNPEGYVYFTMVGTQGYYYKFAKPEINDGLQEVVLSGRLNETTYINFVESEEQLSKMFEIFKPQVIGYYDMVLPNEGSSFHYYYIGKKSTT